MFVVLSTRHTSIHGDACEYVCFWYFLSLISAAVDFLNKVAAAEEQHAQQLMSIVKNYRKKTADNLKKDPWVCVCVCVWSVSVTCECVIRECVWSVYIV